MLVIHQKPGLLAHFKKETDMDVIWSGVGIGMLQ
jgi:hypothetical protein